MVDKDFGQGKGRLIVGKVISNKMDKTLVVRVQRAYVHPVLGKVVRVNKSYKVHDESNVALVGDEVEIYHGRPKSKTKYTYLSRVLRSSGGK